MYDTYDIYIYIYIYNGIFGTKRKSLVKLQYFQQNLHETLPKDTPA